MCPKTPPNACSARRGFTLVELLVASTLMAIILGGVYAAFSTTIRSWRIGEASVETYQGARISLALMTRELRSVVPGSDRFFEGDDNELLFYTVSPPLEVEEGEGPQLLQVRYRLKSDPKGRGRILVREEARLVEGFPEPPEKKRISVVDHPKTSNDEEFELMAGVADLEISYYWAPPVDERRSIGSGGPPAPVEFIVRDENRLGDGLPQAVRIALTVLDANSPSGETVFTTTVPFPGPTTRLTKETAFSIGGLP